MIWEFISNTVNQFLICSNYGRHDFTQLQSLINFIIFRFQSIRWLEENCNKKNVGARNNEDLFQKDSFSWDILFPFLFLQTFSLFSLGQLRDYDRNSKLTPYSLYTSTFKPHLDKKLVNSNCICGNGAIYAIRRSRSWVGWNSVGYRTKLVLCFWYEIQLVFIVL